MEALIFLFNGLVLLTLVVSSLLNDRCPPGKPLVGPFRYEEEGLPEEEAEPSSVQAPPRGRRHGLAQPGQEPCVTTAPP
jgi:hypothetical protein